MAAKIISLLANKYAFNADEALIYYNEHKSEANSVTSINSIQRAENAIAKTRAEIDELKAKIPSKKGKMLENANVKLAKLEEKIAEQMRKLDEKKAKEAAKAAPKTPKKPKKASDTPPAPKKEKKEDDRRIKRMSPTATKQLTKVFEDAGREFNKEMGSQFAKYINELNTELYEGKNLADHMRDFVATVAPSGAPSGALPKDFDVKEPEAVPDEDMTEVTFEGVKYVVGDISKRVYEADEENGDRFVGFIGLGKFKNMKVTA